MHLSHNGPWGFFDPSGSFRMGLIHHSYLVQLPGIVFFVFLISSLFIFKKYYLKTTYLKWFRISLGIYQISAYFIYYFISISYLAIILKENYLTGPEGATQVRGLSEAMPLHLCSIQQLLSGLILIFPTKRFFEICAPSALILPILAIVTPVNNYWSVNNFFYWNYFILHSIIIFAYLYVYKYNLVKKPYSGLLLKYQFIWLLLFSVFAVGYDYIFKLNLLYVGPKTGNASWEQGGFNLGHWNTNYLFGHYAWPFSWVAMFLLGTVMISITHVIIFFFNQYTLEENKKEIKIIDHYNYYSKIGFGYIALTLKLIFYSDSKIIKFARNYKTKFNFVLPKNLVK